MTAIVNGRLQTAQGMPKSLFYELPTSMIDSTKIENRIMPYGNTIFGSTSSANFGGQIIKFVIPRTDRAFFNSQTVYITGQCDIGGTFGTAAGTDMNFVLGTYWSLFSRYVVSCNGKVLETIERPGELVNMLLNMTLNPAEKKGMAMSLGYYNDMAGADQDATTNICQAINTDGTSPGAGKTFTFALPLVGMLNNTKQIPMFAGDITIELTLNPPSNWLVGNTTSAVNAMATIYPALSQMELVFDQLTLSTTSFQMLMLTYPEKIHIKTASYDFGAGNPIATAGAIDIPVNIKRSSLKTVFVYFTNPTLIDKSFGGINPNLTDLTFVTNGTQYPQRPLRCNNVSEMYMQIQKTFGAIYSNSHSGSCGRAEFARRSDANNNYLALTTALADITKYGHKFYVAIDTELINYDSESLYSGISMGVNSNFRLNIAPAPVAVTPLFWLNYDAVIEFDLINNQTNVIA